MAKTGIKPIIQKKHQITKVLKAKEEKHTKL